MRRLSRKLFSVTWGRVATLYLAAGLMPAAAVAGCSAQKSCDASAVDGGLTITVASANVAAGDVVKGCVERKCETAPYPNTTAHNSEYFQIDMGSGTHEVSVTITAGSTSTAPVGSTVFDGKTSAKAAFLAQLVEPSCHPNAYSVAVTAQRDGRLTSP